MAEHKHKIGFEGTLLIEPKPMEPTKHQYDYDTATVHGFLAATASRRVPLNIEANHATLAGTASITRSPTRSPTASSGSIDANRGDSQNGWDTDQFPNSVDELSLALYEILRGGGFTTGGFNFDAKLRRQSIDRDDLFHAHIGGIDTLARALLVAADMLEDGTPRRAARRSLRRLGRGARHGDPRRRRVARVARRARGGGRDRPAARSPVARSGSRAS